MAGLPVRAQIVIPNQQHEWLTFELHSVRDDVVLYIGDPQDFFRMYWSGALPPRLDFTNPARVATIRIRDLSLFEEPPPLELTYIDGEEDYEEPRSRIPDAQSWDMRLSPAAPAKFVLVCEEGKGVFDFTDMEVREVYLYGDSTEVRVEFSRPNLVELERCKLTAEGGKLEFREVLNARPKSVTIQTARTECDIQITGEPFDGQAEIFFEGVPKSMRIVVSRNVGLRLDGPAATISRFDADHMERRGQSLFTMDYEAQRCRLRLHFAEHIPGMQVSWE